MPSTLLSMDLTPEEHEDLAQGFATLDRMVKALYGTRTAPEYGDWLAEEKALFESLAFSEPATVTLHHHPARHVGPGRYDYEFRCGPRQPMQGKVVFSPEIPLGEVWGLYAILWKPPPMAREAWASTAAAHLRTGETFRLWADPASGGKIRINTTAGPVVLGLEG